MAKVSSKQADVIKMTCKKHIEMILASFQGENLVISSKFHH